MLSSVKSAFKKNVEKKNWNTSYFLSVFIGATERTDV